MVAIVGASGSGKTTLIQHLNGLLEPSSGSIAFGPGKVEAKDLFRKVGLAFQFPENQLFEKNVFEDVAYGPRNLRLPEEDVAEAVRRALSRVGLSEDLWRRSPFQLSEGEKRRAAIAGILAMQPEVLVMDEPTSGLDRDGSDRIEAILRDFNESGGTVVFVSHDMDLVGRLGRRILLLSSGRLLFDGTREAFFSRTALLRQSGLETPSCMRFMTSLKMKGLPVNDQVFSVEEAKRELMRVFRGEVQAET
ncbi:energy-coupling factor transporter ATPase [bacterium]|nr:energy-coupling factor transporter ATPase [bacterium]